MHTLNQDTPSIEVRNSELVRTLGKILNFKTLDVEATSTSWNLRVNSFQHQTTTINYSWIKRSFKVNSASTWLSDIFQDLSTGQKKIVHQRNWNESFQPPPTSNHHFAGRHQKKTRNLLGECGHWSMRGFGTTFVEPWQFTGSWLPKLGNALDINKLYVFQSAHSYTSFFLWSNLIIKLNVRALHWYNIEIWCRMIYNIYHFLAEMNQRRT